MIKREGRGREGPFNNQRSGLIYFFGLAWCRNKNCRRANPRNHSFQVEPESTLCQTHPARAHQQAASRVRRGVGYARGRAPRGLAAPWTRRRLPKRCEAWGAAPFICEHLVHSALFVRSSAFLRRSGRRQGANGSNSNA